MIILNLSVSSKKATDGRRNFRITMGEKTTMWLLYINIPRYICSVCAIDVTMHINYFQRSWGCG